MKRGKQIKINVNLGQSHKMASVVRNTDKLKGMNVIFTRTVLYQAGQGNRRIFSTETEDTCGGEIEILQPSSTSMYIYLHQS